MREIAEEDMLPLSCWPAYTADLMSLGPAYSVAPLRKPLELGGNIVLLRSGAGIRRA